MVRALDYIWDNQTARVRAWLCIFGFFQNFALPFIIQNYFDSKEKIIKKYLLLFKIIGLDPLVVTHSVAN